MAGALNGCIRCCTMCSRHRAGKSCTCKRNRLRKQFTAASTCKAGEKCCNTCRAEDERRRQLDAEQRAREAEEQQILEEARAAKEAERRNLDKLARRFAVKLEGSSSINKPPKVCL
jgi:hypothetical protein